MAEENTVHKEIGLIIRTARVKRKMSQLELARHLGYNSPQFVSLFERGISKVPGKTLGQISSLLKISQNKIVDLLVAEFKEELLRKIKSGSPLKS